VRALPIPAGVDRVVRRYEPLVIAVVVALGIVALVPPLHLDPLALGGIAPFADDGGRGPAPRPVPPAPAPAVEASPSPAPAPVAITAPEVATASRAPTNDSPLPPAAPRALLRPGGAGIAVRGAEVVVTRPGRLVRTGAGEVELPAGAAPVGVVVLRDGTAFVSDGASGRVFRVDGDRATVLLAVPDVRPCLPVRQDTACDGSLLDQRPSLAGIAVDGAGRLYVADAGQRAIWRVDGERVEQWLVDPGLSPPGSAGGPSGLAVDGAGNLLVSTPSSGTLVLVSVDAEGRPGARRTLTTFAEGAGPSGLALAPDGRAFVALRGAGLVAVVAPTGEVAREVDVPDDLDLGAPVGVAVRDGDLLVVGEGAVVALSGQAQR
jgi:sugar lactone lactonase YvrE